MADERQDNCLMLGQQQPKTFRIEIEFNW